MGGIDLKVPPIDENIFKTKVAEGYSVDVIRYQHVEDFKSSVKDFLDKSAVLKKHSGGRELSYYDFMDLVFPGVDDLMVITANETYTTMNEDDLLDYMKDRDDVYVSPCTFIHGCYKSDTCKDIHALVIDIDNVDASVIDNVLKNQTLGKTICMPSIITASGRGLHFWWIIDKLPYYKKQRKQIHEVYRRLFGMVKKNIYGKADWHSIIQPFRLPGSLTKLGLVATAYQFNDKWKIEDLAKRVGVTDVEWDLTERKVLSQQEYKEHLKQTKKYPKKSRKINMERREGLQGFYDYALKRTYENTAQGRRYTSMVALTIIGYKARIPKEELEEDFKKLAEHYNSIGTVFREKEIKKALKTYNIKAEKVRSETLENMFGWCFERKRAIYREVSKKPQRTREEHLKRARAIQEIDYPNGSWRNKEGRPTKENIIREWRENHPGGTKAECLRELNEKNKRKDGKPFISRPTIHKWWNA